MLTVICMSSPVRTISALLVLLTPCAASAAEPDYGLSCSREIVDAGRGSSRPAAHPVSARVHFTGGVTSRLEADGSRTVYSDLVLTVDGIRLPGGAVEGSNFGSSTVYDAAYRRTGESSTTWAFSRDFGAFTLRHQGRWYVCRRT